MPQHTRPARHLLRLNLVALALLHAGDGGAPALPSQTPPPTAAQPQSDTGLAGDPVSKEWVLRALDWDWLSEEELLGHIEGRGVTFRPTAADEEELRAAGATLRVLEAVHRSYRRPRPEGGGGPVDYARTFSPREVTRKALIISKPDPGYTAEARRNDVEGFVRLRIVLNPDGKVTDVSVVKGLPDGLTERAVAAAKKIQFTPAEKDGRKVSQYAVIDYNFVAAYMHESDVDERAVILEKPPAEYTEEARRNGVQGKVVLKVAFASFGVVKVVSAEQGLPHGLTEKAEEAAQRIKFTPARLGGRAVTQLATVEYVFAP